MPVNITYGSSAGDNDILQAAQALAAQNMQKRGQNIELANNLAGSLTNGFQFGYKIHGDQEAARAAQAKAQATAQAAAADQALKRQTLQVQAARLTPEQRIAAGLPVLGGPIDYSKPETPGEQLSQPTDPSGLPQAPVQGAVQPGAAPLNQPSPGAGVPGQYMSANESQQGAGQQFQPADIHSHTSDILDNTANGVLGKLGSAKLNETGRVQFNRLASDVRAIQKQRANLRPASYNKALSSALHKIRSTFGGTNIDGMTIKEKTPEELLSANVAPGTDGSMYTVTKNEKGIVDIKRLDVDPTQEPVESHFARNVVEKPDAYFIRDSNGDFKMHPKKKAEEEEVNHLKKKIYDHLANPEVMDKEWERAVKRIQEKRVNPYNKDTEKDKFDAFADKQPTDDEVRAEIINRHNANKAWLLGMAHHAKVVDDTLQQAAQIQASHTVKMGAAQTAAGASGFPMRAQGNAAGQVGLPGGQQSAGQQQAPPTTPGLTAAAISKLPLIKTREEYDKLPSGQNIQFVVPGGKLKIKP